MADVTLTPSMRSNLYSLQSTADLMATTQQRLSTGRKVNSALDNPNNYFSAQSLTNRASDISALLDGMGQAISTIKLATSGIESAQKVIDSMKAVANNALSSASTVASSARTPMQAAGTVDSSKLILSEDDNTTLLTNLIDGNSLNQGIKVGDTLSVGNATLTNTFTVTETSTVKDLVDFMESTTFLAGENGVTVNSTTGAINLNSQTANVKVAGAVATALNIANADMGAANTVSTGGEVLKTGPSKFADVNAAGTFDDAVMLTSLTDSSGTSLGIAFGDTITVKAGASGNAVTFTVGGSNNNSTYVDGVSAGGSTLKDLQDWLEKQDGGTNLNLTMTSGKLTVTNADTALDVTVAGKLGEALGINGTVVKHGTVDGTLTSTVDLYSTLQSAAPQATGTTLLRDLTSANGTLLSGAQGQVGDRLTVTLATKGATTIDITAGMTVNDLVQRLNQIDSGLTVSFANGKFTIDNQSGGTVAFSGAAAGFFTDDSDGNTTFNVNTAGNAQTSRYAFYAGFKPAPGAAGTTTIDATAKAQFDTLRTQLDQLVKDASYQGINLISGTDNSALTVTFNEAATNANKLVINAVDLTTTGLGIKAAGGDGEGAWNDVDAVRAAISTLTDASTTYRTQAQTLGTNLSTVQTREGFTKDMVQTLQEGADRLTLADMNTEGANMLALQTRQQLGVQALSLANQANQAVLRLFG